MTRNNLSGHLRWLLSSKACAPPPPPPVQTSTNSSSIESAASSIISEQQPTATQDSSSTIDANTSMARLRTAPTPNPKSTLVSQHPPDYVSKPAGETNSRHDVETNTSRLQSERQLPLTKVRPTPQPVRRRAYDEDVGSDIEALDMTNSERASKFASVPVPRSAIKNKKRTSDEFEEDLFSAKHETTTPKVKRERTTRHSSPHAEFTAIDDILDGPPAYPPPPYSTVPSNRVPGGPGQWSKASRPPAYAGAANGERERVHSPGDVPQGRKRKSFSRTNSELHDLAPQPSRPCIKESPVRKFQSPAKRESPSQKPPLSARRQVVADSEEEDGVADTGRAMGTASPSKRLDDQDTKAAHAGTIQAGPESAKSQLATFMGWPESRVQAYQQHLQKQRRTKAQLVAQAQFRSGHTPLSDLQQQLRLLKQQFEASEELQRLRSEYARSTRRRIELEERVVEAIEDDPDMGGSVFTAAFEECQAVAKTEKHVETQMLQLLSASGLLGDGAPNELLDWTSESGVAIESTQTTPMEQQTSRTLGLNSDIPNTQLVVQTQQVRSGSSVAESPCKPKSRTWNKSPAETIVRHPDRSLPTKTGSEYSSRSDQYKPISESVRRGPPSPPKWPRSTQGVLSTPRQAPTNERELTAYGGLDFEADEALFTTNMGTPPSLFIDNEEAFECSLADDEMLDFADGSENFELPQKPTRRLGERSAMRTVSGNERQPPTLPTSAKGKQPAKLSVPDAASQLMQFEWSADVKQSLLHRFKLRGFRSNQLEAINATLGGKDAFVLMPTGGGKSLCYQLPSIVRSGKTRGVTVVISPLLSLMEDQVASLQRLKVQAYRINSECTAEEKRFIYQSLREPKVEDLVQILYVAPEMINLNKTFLDALLELHSRRRLARIVIDEAHCVSQWGHDFRPDYKAIGDIRNNFKGVPAMALTATATENVKADVIHNLGMKGCQIFTQSFNRPNLTYEVRPKGGPAAVLEDIADIITKKHNGQSGIIYCLSRKTCEQVAEALQKKYRIKAHHYHAQIEPQEKRRVQQFWQSGKYSVIVATIAFGMGIDKPDVRYVIHHTIPKTLEGYYQETGRAGRDGLRSGCYLFYGHKDTTVLRKMIQDGEGDAQQKQRQHAMLRSVVQFCENKADCRRVQVLAYFNESFARENCNGGCDNCNSTSTFETRDYSDFAKSAIRLVRELQDQDVTIHQFVDIFRGASSKKIKDMDWAHLDAYGCGSELDRGDAERLFYRLMSEEALQEKNKTNRAGFTTAYVMLGQKWREIELGRKKLQIQVRITPNPKQRNGKLDKPRTKHATGVAGSRSEYPLSTNVSSPIQAASRRRAKARNTTIDDSDDDDAFEAMHPNAYKQDGFVVDDHNDEYDTEFEPIRDARKPQARKRPDLGPPITLDEKMAGLNEMHHHVVEDFVRSGRDLCRKILMEHSLRSSPFSDSILREMAIGFPHTLDEMLVIPDINKEMVNLHGRKFLKLIDGARKFYEGMMQEGEDRDNDPNHKVVIDLCNDSEGEAPPDDDNDNEDEEDYGEYPSDDDAFDEGPVTAEGSQGLRSSYFASQSAADKVPSSFELPAHVMAANSKWNEIQDRASQVKKPSSAAPSKFGKAPKKSWKGKKGAGKGAKRGSGGFSSAYRVGSSFSFAAPKSRSSSGGAKRAPTSSSAGPSRSGIGMMPV